MTETLENLANGVSPDPKQIGTEPLFTQALVSTQLVRVFEDVDPSKRSR